MAVSSILPEGAPGSVRVVSYLEWGPVVAGAIAAAAISLILLTFGAAVGLTLTSPWPNAGARLWIVALVVAWWAVAVQIASFAAGGYLAGRMRNRWPETGEEGQFRDNAHGLMVWALGVLVGGIMLALTTGGVLRTTTQSAAVVAAGVPGAAALSTSPAEYATDLLLRPESGGAAASPAAGGLTPQRDQNDQALRSETSRIFTSTIRNQEFSERDRAYLVRLIQSRTGLPEAEAQRRVDASVNEARDQEIKVRETADKARKAAILTGFIAAASLLISLVVACLMAGIGGRHRDEGRTPHFHGHRFW